MIVYIFSTNYAGSHFLSKIIGSHSYFMHIGEIKRLRKPNNKKPLCGVCEDDSVCPVLRNLDHSHVDDVYEKIFANQGDDISGLVDTSKKTFWAKKFLEDKRYTKKFIHLIRDPRALTRRWLITRGRSNFRERIKEIQANPKFIIPFVFGDMIDVYTHKWLAQNMIISEFLNKNSLDSYVMTYHDLVKSQEIVLRDLMSWLQTDYEPGQEEYWNFEHHGSTKVDYEKLKTNHFDCRWKEFFSESQQERILNPKVLTYMEMLGVTHNEEGLVKNSIILDDVCRGKYRKQS